MSRKYLLDCSARGAKWADDVQSDATISRRIISRVFRLYSGSNNDK